MNKKINIFIYILSSIFILIGIFGFSFWIPKKDAKIHEIELELEILQFDVYQFHLAQIQGHMDLNLMKVLEELNSAETQQLLQDSIDGKKAAIMYAHPLKTGEFLHKDTQEFKNLYPGTTLNEVKEELKKIKFTYFDEKGEELKKQKDAKKDILGWSILFQIIGFVLLHTSIYYKEYK